ncbi:DUF3455 domain-containing protein [soil metagenome]
MISRQLTLAIAGLSCVAAAGCSMPLATPVAPDAVMAPAPAKPYLDTLGIGEITYECRETAGKFEWAFVGPVATLYDANKKTVGKYYAGPTWEANDGSKVTGKQVATAPSPNPASIPLQLVKVDPVSSGMAAMNGVSYIQRLDTKKGVPPTMVCDSASKGSSQKVAYEARYVFYR